MKNLITHRQAMELVLSVSMKTGNEIVSLSRACGRRLEEDVRADRDFPPYHRVTMDGIALTHNALEQGIRQFDWQETQGAGDPPFRLKNSASCIEIMTGACLPEGCDSIVPYEDLEEVFVDGRRCFRIRGNVLINKGQNIHSQGSDAKKGECLLKAGRVLQPNDLAIAASCGMRELRVASKPRFAIVCTGNELIDTDAEPAFYQIRMSNGHFLKALLESNGAEAEVLMVEDSPEQLSALMTRLKSNYSGIVLSGGVSRGKYDYVPEILPKCGFSVLFHGVKQRPGKPFLFAASGNLPVFALPGNPVSVAMCAYVYLLAFLRKHLQQPEQACFRVLANGHDFQKPLDLFLIVRPNPANPEREVIPVGGNGSGDFLSLRQASGFLYLESPGPFEAGKEYPFYSIIG
jgi:molybdopterin molybdotransferase